MKKRKRSILQRDSSGATAAAAAPWHPSKKQRKPVTSPSPHHAVRHQRVQPFKGPRGWTCASVVDRQAAAAVGKLLAADETRRNGVSIKTLTLAPHIVAKAATHAVTCETLKHIRILHSLLEQVRLLDKHPQLQAQDAYVLVYELLFGEGFGRQRGPAERAVTGAKQLLEQALAHLLKEAGAKDVSGLLPSGAAAKGAEQQQQQQRPRTARVNLLVATVDEVMAWLAEHGQDAGVRRDPLLPDVLHFPPGTRMHDHPLVSPTAPPPQPATAAALPAGGPAGRGSAKTGSKTGSKRDEGGGGGGGGGGSCRGRGNGEGGGGGGGGGGGRRKGQWLVLQGRSSCMPAHALRPRPGWVVIDACAAPGNKTTHLAALIASSSALSSSPHPSSSTCAGSSPLPSSLPSAHGVGSEGKHGSRVRRVLAGDGDGDGGGKHGGQGGRVLAFDRDAGRLKRLEANVRAVGAQHIVEAQQADFLSLEPEDERFAHVRGMLLDPSCSGSGTGYSRGDHLLPSSSSAAPFATPSAAAAAGTTPPLPASSIEQRQQRQGSGVDAVDGGGESIGGGGGAGDADDADEVVQVDARVESLARFQEKALSHALRFPGLLRLVYSTCSVHQRENEDVVAAVMQQAVEAGFELADPFPGWHRRGLPVLPGAERLVRVDPEADQTDGFFVALFQRRRWPTGGSSAADGVAEDGGDDYNEEDCGDDYNDEDGGDDDDEAGGSADEYGGVEAAGTGGGREEQQDEGCSGGGSSLRAAAGHTHAAAPPAEGRRRRKGRGEGGSGNAAAAATAAEQERAPHGPLKKKRRAKAQAD